MIKKSIWHVILHDLMLDAVTNRRNMGTYDYK